MYNCFFVLIDLSFEKMPRKFVELQKKMLHIYKWLVCFGLCCKVRMRKFPFSILFDWKKKRLFQKYKAMDIFLYYKNALKKLKKETEKNDDSGVGFCNREGQKEQKIMSDWGNFSSFFTSHLYSNHSLNLIILWFILFFDRCHEKGVGSKSSLHSANPANSRLSFCRSALTWIWFFWAR